MYGSSSNVSIGETMLRRENKVLRTIRDVNKLIARETELDALLQKTCNVLVETSSYAYAWIFTSDDRQEVFRAYQPQVPTECDPLSPFPFTKEPCFCIEESLKSEDVVFLRNRAQTCQDCPALNVFAEGVAITAKISFENQLFGFLTLYLEEQFMAQEVELKLISELASDLGQGLHELQMREQNIAELHESIQTLGKRERFLQNVYDAIQDGISILDTSLTIINVNSVVEKRQAHNMPVVGKKCYDAYQSRQTACSRCPAVRTIETGLPQKELLFVPEITVNGRKERSWVELSTFPLKNQEGVLIGVIEYTKDVTEQKIAEEKYREVQDRLNLAVESAGIGLWDWEVQTGKTVFNEQWAQMVGYTLEELQPCSFKVWAQMVHPDDLQESEQCLNAHFSGEKVQYECKVRMKHKNGDWVWVLTRGKVVEWDSNFKPVRMTGTHVDITDLKNTQAKLAESAKNFRGFFQAIDDLFLVATLDGKILMTNYAYQKKLGYTQQELQEMTLMELHPEHQRMEAAQRLKDILQGTRSVCNLPLCKKDGTQVSVESRIWLGRWNHSPVLFGISKDLTEQEAALEQFRDMFEHNPSPMALTQTEDSVFIDVNRAFCKLLECEKHEVLGKTAIDLHVFEDVKKFLHMKQDIREKGFVSNISLHIRTRKGNLRYGQFSGEIIKLQTGTFFLTTILDLTDRVAAENALQQNRRFLEMITETTPSFLYIYDVGENRTVWTNAAHSEMFKDIFIDPKKAVTADDLIEKIHPDDVPVAFGALEKLRTQEVNAVERLEYRLRDKDGHFRWFEEWKTVFERTPNGNIKSIICAGHEITERKLNELEIRKLSKIVEQSPLSVVITDIKGHIEYVNQAFTKTTGYSFEEVKGQNPRILKTSNTSQEEYEKLWATITARKEWNGEFYNKKKNGEFFWENAIICPLIDEHDQITHFIGIKEDITEKKRDEEDRLQSQKMEAVGKLAGGIAHDLNNILTVIIANSDLSLAEVDEHSELYENIVQIEKAADRAAHLVRQLLAFSRKQILRKKVIDINHLISNFEKMLRRVIKENIILTTKYCQNLSQIKADPAQIEQAILNLVINARDAMEFGGHLSIETQNTMLDEVLGRKYNVAPGKYVCISITDTGIGMSEEIQKKIFEPFFTTKPIYEGAGLGLSMVFGVISQSGGTVQVKSVPNEGATFNLYLPAIDGERALEEQPKAVKPLPKAQETILIVEDEALIRDTIASSLKRQGYKTLTATDGDEALAFSQAYADTIHLLLTDVVMPNMSGKQLSDSFTTVHPETNFIYMSGYADKEVLKHGVSEDELFIQKPFTIHELSKVIAKALKKEAGAEF